MRILFILLLLLANLTMAQAQSPDESYLQIYHSILEADGLNASGQASLALGEYQEARAALRQLQATRPDWNKKVIQYKLIYVEQKLTALGAAPDEITIPEPPAPVAPPVAVLVPEKVSPPKTKPAAAPDSASANAVSVAPGLKMLSRKNWKAKPPVSAMTPHIPTVITIHHTATKQNPKKSLAEKLQSLQAYSQREATLDNGKKKPAWPDVLYHFYIAVDGEIGEGRDINFVGETNTEYNPATHILVCLEGNFENEEPTEAQMESTTKLVRWLAQKYQVPPDKISAHKDHAKTACPGKNLYSKLDDIRASSQSK